MTSAFSWKNSVSLCPASFCIPRPNLPVTPGVSWLPTFAFQSSIMKRTFFFLGGPSSQGYGFSCGHVWMWELDYKESWAWRIDAFELWCWGRLLRVPWTARSSKQSILKDMSPGCSLEGLMLKLKFQYFGHLMWRVDSLEKTLMLGEIGVRRRRGNRGWDGWMASLTQWMWVWLNSRSWWWTRRPGVLQFMGTQRSRHDWVTELKWTELD